MIVTFAKWSDKMAVLTKGREGLKRKGVRVAGDLTSKQQANIQEQRDRGMHAYYKGNRLVVAGPLQHRPALQRGQHRHSGEQNRRPTEDRRAHSHPGRRTQQTEGSGYRAEDLPRPRTRQHHDRNDPSRDIYGTRQHHDRNDKPRDTYGTRQHHDRNKPRSTYDTWQHDDCQNTVWGNYDTITTGIKPTPDTPPCTTSRPYKGTETPQMATTPTTCSVFPWLNNNSQLN